MESTTTLTPLLAPSPNGSQLCDTYIWRPMRLRDAPVLAQIQAKAYWKSPINNFVAPNAPAYPGHLIRKIRQGILLRLLKDNTVSIVACLADIPDIVVGYTQFSRVGAPQKSEMEINMSGWGKWSRWALAYIFSAIFWVQAKLEPDLAVSEANMKLFNKWGGEDMKKQWGPQHPERQDRWEVSSLLVDPLYQGKGLGKLLMQEPIKRAQRDGIHIGLIASPHGWYLYKKLGFELLADFTHRIEGEDDEAGGGIMMWTPKGSKVGDKKND